MATTQTIESIISAFPYASIRPIVGAPTYESINEVATLLKAKASAIHTENGGGQLGYLGLTVSAAVYNTNTSGRLTNYINILSTAVLLLHINDWTMKHLRHTKAIYVVMALISN